MTTCLTEGTLQAYLDQELATDEAGRAIAHLAECCECARRVRESEQERVEVWNALGVELPASIPTARLRARIEARLATAEAPTFTRMFWIQDRRTGLVAATLVAAVIVVAWVLLPPRQPGERAIVAQTENREGTIAGRQSSSPQPPEAPSRERGDSRRRPRHLRAVSEAAVGIASTTEEDASATDLFEGPYFFDVETTRHLEKAQVLLRSFNNATLSRPAELAYERQQSKGLLYANVLLRREAEADQNSPAKSVLGSLEPFLLDIANLPDRPRSHEVLSVRERIRSSEIVAALQVYSTRIASMD